MAKRTRNSPLHHIETRRDGYVVRINRLGIKFQAFIACGPHSSLATRQSLLADAIRIRDRFMANSVPAFPKRASRSNTGIPGITETVKWVKYKPWNCFHVHLGRDHHPQNKRIYYGRTRTRDQALQQAIALRQQVTRGGASVPASRPTLDSGLRTLDL